MPCGLQRPRNIRPPLHLQLATIDDDDEELSIGFRDDDEGLIGSFSTGGEDEDAFADSAAASS